MNYELSQHAQDEALRRQIPRALIDAVMQSPQQIVDAYEGKSAYQSQLDFGAGKIYLLRLIVDDAVEPARIVTVYRTSRIAKYWRATT
ncbi:MAG: DUF4258 domain-containing protein [Pyrinomonadaceae bacterium]